MLLAAGGWASTLRVADLPAQRTVLGKLVERVVPVRLGRAGHDAEVTWTPVGEALRRLACAVATEQERTLCLPVHQKGKPAYELPIAVALIQASEQVPVPPEPPCYLGEHSLDGGLRHTNGILPMVSPAVEMAHVRGQ